MTTNKKEYHHFVITENDIAVISVLSYGGRVPDTTVKRLMELQGYGARAIIVYVYGNCAYEDTLVDLKDTV